MFPVCVMPRPIKIDQLWIRAQQRHGRLSWIHCPCSAFRL